MEDFITIKHVKAEPMEKDGIKGMAVHYSDGYVSWCPLDTFKDTSVRVNEQAAPHILEALKKITAIASGG